MSSRAAVLTPHHDHGPGCGCVFLDARRDPTGTRGTTSRFEADLLRRFRRIKALVRESLVQNDALGLNNGPKLNVSRDPLAAFMVSDAALPAGRFAFTTSKDKVDGFMAWLKQQEAEGVLGIVEGTPVARAADRAWTNTYVASAYQKGLEDAGAKLRQAGADVQQSWIENAFNRPIHADRAGLIFTRTFTELRGITESMDQRISRVLAEGIANGRNPLAIARDINQSVDRIGITRARTLARTEVINAHATATLNGYEEAGIHGVEVEAEWLTAANPCRVCVALKAGGPYTLDQARGLIPAHPNCRCAWAPKVVGGTGIELV